MNDHRVSPHLGSPLRKSLIGLLMCFSNVLLAQEMATVEASPPYLWWLVLVESVALLGMLAYIGQCKQSERHLRAQLQNDIQKALHEREQWFATTLKSIGEAVITTDTEGKVTFLNPAAETLTGWRYPEASGKTIGFNSTSEDTSPDEMTIHLGESPVLIGRDGRAIPVEYSGSPIKDASGRVRGMVIVLKDRTERKRAEEQLRAAHDDLERRVMERTADLAKANDELRILGKAVETMQLGVTIADASGRILYTNPADARTHGYAVEELIGRNVQMLAPPERRKHLTPEQIEAMRGWVRESLNIRKDQTVFPVYLISTVVRDDAGKFLAIVTTCEDITERKRTQAILAEERNLLRTLIESLPDTIYVKNIQGRIVLVNRTELVAHANHQDEVEGRFPEDLLACGLVEHCDADDQTVMTTGQSILNREEQHRDAITGTVHWFSTTKVPLHNSQGTIIGLVGIHRDITAQKATELKIAHINAILRAIQDVNPSIVREKNRRILLQKVCRGLLETRGFQAALICLLDDSGALTELAEAGVGEGISVLQTHLERGEVPPCFRQALNQPEALMCQQPLFECLEQSQSPLHSDHQKIIVRLHHNDKRYGLLITIFPQAVGIYDEDKALLEDVANDIAFALYNIDVEEERKQADKTLRENERFLNSVFDAIQDGIAVHDRDLKILRSNRWMEQRYSQGASLVGKPCYDVIHHQPQPCPWCPALETLQTGKPYRKVIPCTLADGSEGWLDLSTFPLFDEDAEIGGVIEYMKDITEQKKAEKSLEIERKRLFDLLENLPVYVYLQAPDYTIHFANRSFRERFGEPERGRCYRLLWGRGDVWAESPSYRVFYTYQPQEWEWNHYPTGKIYQVYDYPFTDFDGSPLVLELGIDITERKQMELALKEERALLAKKVDERTAELSTANQQLQQEVEERKQIQIELQRAKEVAEASQRAAESANQAKSEFLANMSHELRTPLNAILGYAQILKTAENLTERQIEGLETIKTSGQHLLNLINELLDLSKIETGHMELEQKNVHLPDFLRGIAEMIRIRAEQKKLAFVYEADPTLPEGVRVDDRKLRQILINLLGNAVKFTETGRVTLRVQRVYEFPELKGSEVQQLNNSETQQLRFEVEDTGVGIAADELEDIFIPFHQAGEHRHAAEGTGLGLTISRNLVRMLGGELTVRSTPGQGSLFGFELLLPEVEGVSPETVRPHGRRIIGYKGEQRTLLVTDDRRENRAFLVHALVPLGFRVIEAENGHECVEEAYAYHPDLILLDLRMPLMDGFEAARHIRKIQDLENIPIIAISASAYEEIRQKSFQSGCNLFLTKPIDLDELLDLLQMALHVEWIYAERAETPAPKAIDVNPSVILNAIPDEQIQKIIELASKGRAKKLLDYLDDLERRSPESAGLLQEMRDSAKRFQFQDIMQRLQTMRMTYEH